MVAPNKKKAAAASGGNVRVVVRIRPLSSKEEEKACKESIMDMDQGLQQDNTTKGGPEVLQVKQQGGDSNKWYEYDSVLGSRCTQEDVYRRSGAHRSITEDIFKGYNVTMLAYGQTGAGKSYTMGSTFDLDEHAGILPRACFDLFDSIKTKCDGNAKIELSYLEIYNEEIRDLIIEGGGGSNKSPKSQQGLKIRETMTGEIYVSGLSAKEVKSPAEINTILTQAAKRRVTASTAMNAVSSRSHAICSFKISGVLQESEKFTSKLTLVDLAGSERIKKTGAQGSRQLEGIHINKSLMVLGQVVSALSTEKKRKPPYRDSKLTRLLQDSLGGNSRTIMLACVSPADYNVEESVNTLRYATSARNIKNTATRNMVQEISQEEALALRRENQLLKQQITELQMNLQTMSAGESSPGGGSATTAVTEESSETTVTVDEQLNASVSLEVGNAAIEIPALHMEISQLKESLVEKETVEKENEELRQEMEFVKADAKGARVAATQLQDILDQLKGLKQDEVNKKQVVLKHKKKEKEWVDFVARILDRRTDQLNQLQEDFELVIKVVESPAVYNTEERKNWLGRKEFKQVYDPELREKVLQQHVSFFKDRMDEIQNDIFVRAISLQSIRDRIDVQCNRIGTDIDTAQEEVESFETKDNDLLARLVDTLIDPSPAPPNSSNGAS